MDTEVPESRAITKRLDVLERQVRRLKIVIVILLAIIAVTYAPKWRSTNVTADQHLFVNDPHGHLGAALSAHGSGIESLELYDQTKLCRVSLNTTNEGSQLVFQDPGGKPRFLLWVRGDEADMSLFDKHGRQIWHAP